MKNKVRKKTFEYILFLIGSPCYEISDSVKRMINQLIRKHFKTENVSVSFKKHAVYRDTMQNIKLVDGTIVLKKEICCTNLVHAKS